MFLNEASMELISNSYELFRRKFRELTHAICTLTLLLMLLAIASDQRCNMPLAGANQVIADLLLTSTETTNLNIETKNIDNKTETIEYDYVLEGNKKLAGANKIMADAIIVGEGKAVISTRSLFSGVTKRMHDIFIDSDHRADKIIKQEKEKEQERLRLAEEEEERKAMLSAWPKTEIEWDLLYAIVRQEAGDSEEGAWAVIQTAYNRTLNPSWRTLYGTTVLGQLCGKGQYTYSIDGLYKRYLNGNYSDAIVQGVQHCVNGEVRHYYMSFRTTGSAEAASIIGDRANICGNTYFKHL